MLDPTYSPPRVTGRHLVTRGAFFRRCMGLVLTAFHFRAAQGQAGPPPANTEPVDAVPPPADQQTTRPKPAKFNKVLKLGDPAPSFPALAAVDGRSYALTDFDDARLLVLIFTSQKCPVSKAYEARFAELTADFADRGLRVVALSVATGANEQLDKVRQRFEKDPRPYVYLHDPTQAVGQTYGAYVTPQVFILDAQRKVAYMGAFDDHHDRREVVKHYVLDAVDALLAGRPILVGESLPKGCEIEYRDKPQPQPDDTP
jgi:peroxiredoxin